MRIQFADIVKLFLSLTFYVAILGIEMTVQQASTLTIAPGENG